MIKEFIDFTCELIPCITPYTKQSIKDAIRQFEREDKNFITTMEKTLDFLAQGDIVENIPFYRFNSNGKLEFLKGKGIILSNTCDCDRDKDILIAPFVDMSTLEKDRTALYSNQSYGHFYIPDVRVENQVVDFSLSCNFNREVILEGIKRGKILKRYSLNKYGYYLMLCKITIYLMRPEDLEVQEKRMENVVV